MRDATKKVSVLVLLIIVAFAATGCSSKQTDKSPENTTSLKESPQVVVLNDTWNEYTNKNFNYKIKVPSQYYIANAECLWNDNEASYRLKTGFANSQVLEKGNDTFITPTQIYELDGKGIMKNITYYSKCNKTPITIENAPQAPATWKIHAFKANDAKELEKEIQNEYGDKCKVEVLKPTSDANVQDVVITSDPENCFVNYAYFLKYNTTLKTGVSIKLGQAFTFSSDDDFSEPAYDEAMLKSFSFTE